MENNNLIMSFEQVDEAILATLFDKYYSALCYFAFSITKDEAAAEEVSSEAFIKLWERRQNFCSEKAIKAFLYLVVKNTSINFLRLQKRNDQMQKEITYLNDDLDSNKLAFIIQAETYRQVFAAVEALPKISQTVIKLFYIEGKNYAEISEQIKVPISNIRVQKMRGLRILKKML